MKVGANISKTITSPRERLKDNPVYKRVLNRGFTSQDNHSKEPEEDDDSLILSSAKIKDDLQITEEAPEEPEMAPTEPEVEPALEPESAPVESEATPAESAPKVVESELENAPEASANLTLTLSNIGHRENGNPRGPNVTMDIPYGAEITLTCSNTMHGVVLKVHLEKKGTKGAKAEQAKHPRDLPMLKGTKGTQTHQDKPHIYNVEPASDDDRKVHPERIKWNDDQSQRGIKRIYSQSLWQRHNEAITNYEKVEKSKGTKRYLQSVWDAGYGSSVM